MATTVTASKLVVKLSESIFLNGKKYGNNQTFIINSITDIYQRVVTCPQNAETTLMHFHSSVADGTLAPIDIQNAKYIRVTNLDDTNSLTLSLQIDAGEDDSAPDKSASILLGAGQNFVMGGPEDAIGADDDAANFITDLVDLESIVVFCASNVDVEILVAST